MPDNPDLHRDDLQLFAGFFTDGLLAATTITGQLVLRQLMHHLDTRQLGRQWFALAALLGRLRRHDLFIFCRWRCLSQIYYLVEHAQLRRVRVSTLLRLAPEQALTQEADLLLQLRNGVLIRLATNNRIAQHLLKQVGVVRQGVRQYNHAVDYTSVRLHNAASIPCADGCATGQNRPASSSAPRRSARWHHRGYLAVL